MQGIDQLFWFTGATVWALMALALLAMSPLFLYALLLGVERAFILVVNAVWRAGGGSRKKRPDEPHLTYANKLIWWRKRVSLVAKKWRAVLEKVGY